MNVLLGVGVALALLLVFLVVQLFHLSFVLASADAATRGLGYYGLSPAGRARFRRRLRTHARLLWPILRLNERFAHFDFERATFRQRGLPGPRGTCSPESFAAGMSYAPEAGDVFVVTAMKCGTTWMQHVVYELLERGAGDIVASGRTLYALSPWLEALKSVGVDQAPLIGRDRPSRVIKTHLPVTHCPLHPGARYVYVARHPVSCFASCVDFLRTNAGAIAPALAQVEAWFRSPDLMWWGTWPAHVEGWWRQAQAADNVLFVRFEDMKRDLAAVVRRVAAFLDVEPLDDHELAEVVRKCSFDYMKRHSEAFEMHPPHLLQTDAELFVRGSADRHADAPDDLRQRLLAWCAAEIETEEARSLYPDVAAALARTAG